jgi:hypothetical protein
MIQNRYYKRQIKFSFTPIYEVKYKMKLPDIDIDLDEILNDPDKRAKLFLYIAQAMILTTFFIVLGVILFILIVFKII